MSKTYILKLTETQARTVMLACETMARVAIGQWREAFEWLPMKKPVDYAKWHEDRDTIGQILRHHMVDGIDGRSSLGIYSEKADNISRVAWDIAQVLRHRFAWERAVKEKVVPSLDAPRVWPAMWTGDYDEPMHTSEEPLAEISELESLDNRPAKPRNRGVKARNA